HQRGRQKIQVTKLAAVARVPKDAGARTALQVRALRMNRKCRRAAGDNSRDRQAGLNEFLTQRVDRGKSRFAMPGAGAEVGIVDVAVVSVQPARLQSRRRSKETVEFHRLAPRRNTG